MIAAELGRGALMMVGFVGLFASAVDRSDDHIAGFDNIDNTDAELAPTHLALGPPQGTPCEQRCEAIAYARGGCLHATPFDPAKVLAECESQCR